MDKVKRWRPGTHIEPGRTQVYGRMEESDNGGFVWFDDYDQLRQQLAAAEARIVVLHGGNVMLQGECERLNAERDRAVKDAARYRWLRLNNRPDVRVPCPDAIAKCPVRHKRQAMGDDLDALIDAAIAALSTPASEAVAFVEQTAPEGLYARFVDAGNMDTVGPGTKLFATPQPAPAAHAGGEAVPVDALREKLQQLREEVSVQQSLMDHYQEWDDANRLFDELTALLSGGAAREERADNGDPETIVPAPPSRNRWTCKCGKVNPTFDPWCSACEEPQP